MNKINRHKIKVSALTALSLLATACGSGSDDADGQPGPVDGLVALNFSVPAPESADGSAEGDKWSELYNSKEGTSYDSYISADMLHLAVYDETGTFKGEISKIFFLPQETGTEANTYTYLGQLPDGLNSEATYRVMAFANAPGYADAESYATAESNFTMAQLQPDAGIVPMWGVISGKFNIGRRTEFTEPLQMLRAVAKTYITLDDETYKAGFRLKSARLNLSSAAGKIVPERWNAVANTGNIYFRHNKDNVFAPALNPATGGSPAVQPFTAIDNNVMVAYSPEYDNSRNDATITFEITKNDADYTIPDEPFEIHYVNYAEAVPTCFDIARNHIYTFKITIVESAGEEHLRFSVTIADMVKGGDYVLDF